MLKQVEFLIQGYLLPLTMGRLQVSPSFIIEDAMAKKDSKGFFALAFVGVEDEPHFFRMARSKMDLFLLLHTLMGGQAATHLLGAATPLSKLDDLGENRVTFRDYEKINLLNEDIQSPFSKPILSTKERFLQLEKDMHKIMDEHVGLALQYYYYAVQADGKRRYPEVVVDLAIAAEALFSTGRDHKKNLKRRLSSFIAEDALEREKIAERIGDFYYLRGAIVHGGKKKVPLADVRAASEYIRRAIDKALSSKLYTKTELIKEVDKC